MREERQRVELTSLLSDLFDQISGSKRCVSFQDVVNMFRPFERHEENCKGSSGMLYHTRSYTEIHTLKTEQQHFGRQFQQGRFIPLGDTT